MKKIFICSPFRGDEENNRAKAAWYCRLAYQEGFLPIAPHLIFPQFLSENKSEEREAGILMGLELMRGCDEIWVFGEATEGMKREIDFAKEYGICLVTKEMPDGGAGI